MNYLSHIAIAKIIFDQFSQDLKSSLDRQSFIFGNIKPDLANGGIPVPGSIVEAVDQISDKAECILSKIQILEDYSIQMGEICHMVCDAFTDRQPEGAGMLKSLHHLIKKVQSHRTISRFENSGFSAGNLEAASLKDVKVVIFNLLDAYGKKPIGNSKENEYSIAASVWVCESVLKLQRKNSSTYPETPDEVMNENKIA